MDHIKLFEEFIDYFKTMNESKYSIYTNKEDYDEIYDELRELELLLKKPLDWKKIKKSSMDSLCTLKDILKRKIDKEGKISENESTADNDEIPDKIETVDLSEYIPSDRKDWKYRYEYIHKWRNEGLWQTKKGVWYKELFTPNYHRVLGSNKVKVKSLMSKIKSRMKKIDVKGSGTEAIQESMQFDISKELIEVIMEKLQSEYGEKFPSLWAILRYINKNYNENLCEEEIDKIRSIRKQIIDDWMNYENL